MRISKLVLALTVAAGAMTAAVPANAIAYVGSFKVGSGPSPAINLPSYTAREAAAIIFGGSPDDYGISVSPTRLTHTAWVDGGSRDTSHLFTDWNNGEVRGTPVSEDFKLQPVDGVFWGGSSPGAAGYSAWIYDSELNARLFPAKRSVNYVFSLILPGPVPGPVPEPASWVMLIAGFGLVGAAMRRRVVRAA